MSEHVLGGRYRLQRQLGRGGMATVWRARDTRLDRDAAVKILNPGWHTDPVALERLRREAQSVARLAHRNIVGVYDFDVADNTAYLVMELVEGRSVTQLLAVQDRLPVELAVSIAAQICAALGAAHAAGVVHRDIKPSNVLVDQAGGVKVCDFGVALLQRSADQAALTSAGAVVGTCQYMAPEQATGRRVDGRADLYAVGCLLYTMLTGEPPFDGSNPIDVLDQQLNDPPVPLRDLRADVPPDLHRLAGELLAKDPADRPATARSVQDQLTAIGGRVADSAPTMVMSGRHRTTTVASWLRRRAPLLIAGTVVTGVLAALTLTGGGPAAKPRSEPPPSSAASPDATAEPEPTPSSGPSRSSPAPPPTVTTPPPTPTTALDQIGGLATILQEQADAGRLQPKAAKALLHDLDDVARRLRLGKTAEAAEKFAEFRSRVTELGTDTGTDALPDLDPIAESLGVA